MNTPEQNQTDEPIITITITQTVRGWDVGQRHSDGNVCPTTSYPNSGKAAARVLQLMEIGTPISPQDWPEAIFLGEAPGF